MDEDIKPISGEQLDRDVDLVFSKVTAFNEMHPSGLLLNDEDPKSLNEYYDSLIKHYLENSDIDDPEITAACKRILE